MQPSSNNCYDTGLREECGVFGIYDLDGADVSPSIYYGLSALQHRGQESCGIAVSDTSGPKGHVKSYKGLGLVNEVFKESKLEELSGNIGIGHVRYSTTGSRECTAARSELSERLPRPCAQRKSGQRYGTARADGKHRRNFSHFD